MRKIMLAVTFAVLAGASASAQMTAPVNADKIKWGPAPTNLPKGAEMVVLAGDPSKEGMFIVRLKMPNGYKIPAHNHPTTEHLTVISGRFNIGMGDKLDEKKGVALSAGGFAMAPPKMNHYGWASAATIIQVTAMGPFQITYVNPADDPSKKQ